MPDDQKGSLGVRVCAMKRVRVRYHHPIHIMDVSERGDACLVHDKQYQQAQCAYNFFSSASRPKTYIIDSEPQR